MQLGDEYMAQRKSTTTPFKHQGLIKTTVNDEGSSSTNLQKLGDTPMKDEFKDSNEKIEAIINAGCETAAEM